MPHHDSDADAFARWALDVAYPKRDIPVPPSSVTAAELRERAERRRRHRVVRLFQLLTTRPGPARRWAVAGAGVAVALTVLAVNLPRVPEGGAPPSVDRRYAAPGGLEMDAPSASSPARDWLLRLAARLPVGGEGSDDVRYTYIRMQRWVIEFTDAESGVVAFDEHVRWWSDGSGCSAATPLPPQPAGEREARYLTAAWAADCAPEPAGAFSTLIGRPSADPDELQQQLATVEPPANGPQATARAYAAIHEFHILNASQRVAALRVLARVEGLVHRGVTVDRAGRVGVALTVDSGDAKKTHRVRDILVLDASTGALLSHEQVALTAPRERPDLAPNTVTSYVLFLESRHE